MTMTEIKRLVTFDDASSLLKDPETPRGRPRRTVICFSEAC